MKKPVQYIVLILLVVVLIAYVSAQFFLGSIVKAGVNNAGPRLTQSNVVLEAAKISPLSGTGTLKGFTVGNPQGWSDAPAIYLGEMHLDLEPMSFFDDAIVVNDLTIEKPEFVYETRLVSSNIGDLLKNIEAAVGPSGEAQESEAKPRKLIVKHFLLQNAKVTLGVGQTAIPLTLPPIELTDLGVKEGGLTPGQLSFAIMKQITPQIIAAATKSGGALSEAIGPAATDAVKKASEGLQKMLGGKK
jgi:uncharacterized protein involved in outer membrane biogenesis